MPLVDVLCLQEDIEIDHLQADEQKRHDDVQQGMIKQVDDLVEYFNSLYQDDQQGIRWVGGSSADEGRHCSSCWCVLSAAAVLSCKQMFAHS